MDRAEEFKLAGFVLLKRLLSLLIAALGVAAIAWAVSGHFRAPEARTATAAAPTTRLDLRVLGPNEGGPTSVDYARLDARLNRLMENPAMVGLAVGVVENGRIRFLKGYGETAAGSGDPVTPGTIFRWASLSKGVAADMVSLLAGEGRLSLADPAGRYASSLRLPGGTEQTTTIADILSHRTGLFAHAQDTRLEDGMDPHILRAELATLRDICPPGTCHAYQNVVYDTASEIVERITGQPYAAVVRDRLFQPLGMMTASVGRAGLETAPSWARGHVGGKTSRPIETSDSYYRVPAAGGVNGSIQDLAVWMMAQMGEAPAVLPPNVLAAVQTPLVATPGETRRRRLFIERTPSTAYGLGWRILDYSGHRVIGHHGGVRGYRSMILFDPERKSGIVALWNSASNAPNGIEYEVMDMILGLPFHDWLGLDTPHETAAPAVENEGGSA